MCAQTYNRWTFPYLFGMDNIPTWNDHELDLFSGLFHLSCHLLYGEIHIVSVQAQFVYAGLVGVHAGPPSVHAGLCRRSWVLCRSCWCLEHGSFYSESNYCTLDRIYTTGIRSASSPLYRSPINLPPNRVLICFQNWYILNATVCKHDLYCTHTHTHHTKSLAVRSLRYKTNTSWIR